MRPSRESFASGIHLHYHLSSVLCSRVSRRSPIGFRDHHPLTRAARCASTSASTRTVVSRKCLHGTSGPARGQCGESVAAHRRLCAAHHPCRGTTRGQHGPSPSCGTAYRRRSAHWHADSRLADVVAAARFDGCDVAWRLRWSAVVCTRGGTARLYFFMGHLRARRAGGRRPILRGDHQSRQT